MEEVDAYIEQQCKKLNCSFVENADSKDVEFDTRNAFEFLIRCIWQIEPSSEAELPSCELPRHLPTRFRLAKTISDYLEKLGIRGDIGFQNLLYGSLNSLRNIFVDLIRKLPNDSGDVDLESTKTTATEQLSTEPKWVPEFCSRLKMSYDGRFWCPDELGMPELFSFVSKSSNANGMVEDPRNWIAKLLQDTEIDNEANVPKQKRPKPALPPKPKNLSATKEDDLAAKRALLEAALEEREAKRIEFLKVQIESAKVKSSLLHSKRKKLKGFDRRLFGSIGRSKLL
ncbi:unnamed protein product [Caenorhabditis auriculariae]|uniref:CCDC22 N-terminal domain-containing protein n=1 Tax=Caenorhabditis auriculariae TaxID=2777116 RepID=A0A8S1GQN1_9PELO|nr:unnamed protein product [Caenorhabditis auriculariae]